MFNGLIVVTADVLALIIIHKDSETRYFACFLLIGNEEHLDYSKFPI